MFRNEKLEMKVGLFIGVGIFIMFMIVFSVKDFYLFEKGYTLNINFDFVNGLTESAPVRLAGVKVGEVKKIYLFFDEEDKKTKVRINAWVRGNVNIESDAVARINTLGLLGEQYLEISPGSTKEYVSEGGFVCSKNPVHVGRQVEKMSAFMESAANIAGHIEKGEGTMGKFIMEDTLYDDLSTIFRRLKDGEGTIGKLLVEEKVYNDMEEFVSDIKAHPWKLLHKPSRKRKKEGGKKSGSDFGPKS